MGFYGILYPGEYPGESWGIFWLIEWDIYIYTPSGNDKQFAIENGPLK